LWYTSIRNIQRDLVFRKEHRSTLRGMEPDLVDTPPPSESPSY
jgi:hypothetical protein